MIKRVLLLVSVSFLMVFSSASYADEAALRQRQAAEAQEKARAQAGAAGGHANFGHANTSGGGAAHGSSSGRERHGSGHSERAHGTTGQVSEDPSKNLGDGAGVPANTVTPAGNTVTPAGNTVTPSGVGGMGKPDGFKDKGLGAGKDLKDAKGLGGDFGKNSVTPVGFGGAQDMKNTITPSGGMGKPTGGFDVGKQGGGSDKKPGGFDVGGKFGKTGGDGDKKPGAFGFGNDNKTGGFGGMGDKKPTGSAEKNTVTPSGGNGGKPDSSKPESGKGNDGGKTEKPSGGEKPAGEKPAGEKPSGGGKEKLTGMPGEEGSGGGAGIGAGGGSNGTSNGQPRPRFGNPNRTNPSRGDSGDERPPRVNVGGSTVGNPGDSTGGAAGTGLRRESMGDGAHVNPGGAGIEEGVPPRP